MIELYDSDGELLILCLQRLIDLHKKQDKWQQPLLIQINKIAQDLIDKIKCQTLKASQTN